MEEEGVDQEYKQLWESQEKSVLWGMLQEYKKFFLICGKARNYVCDLVVKEHKAFTHRSYPVPYSKRGAVQKEIERMIEADIIEESISAYSNLLVVVMKKDGRVRLCLESEKLIR